MSIDRPSLKTTGRTKQQAENGDCLAKGRVIVDSTLSEPRAIHRGFLSLSAASGKEHKCVPHFLRAFQSPGARPEYKRRRLLPLYLGLPKQPALLPDTEAYPVARCLSATVADVRAEHHTQANDTCCRSAVKLKLPAKARNRGSGMGKATVESSRQLDAHYWARPTLRLAIAPLAVAGV